jgi:hypothetical protein
MSVAKENLSTGNSGNVPAIIFHLNIAANTATNAGTITTTANTTTVLIFVEIDSQTNTITAVTLAGTAATLISGSFIAYGGSANGAGGIACYEVKSPGAGTNKQIQVKCSAAQAVYTYAISCTGSDTVNPSTPFSGHDSGTGSIEAVSSASPSSIPNTDLVSTMFSNPLQGWALSNGVNYPFTGGTGETFIDGDGTVAENVAAVYISGNNNTITAKGFCGGSPGISDNWCVLAIWVAVPAAAGTIDTLGTTIYKTKHRIIF